VFAFFHEPRAPEGAQQPALISKTRGLMQSPLDLKNKTTPMTGLSAKGADDFLDDRRQPHPEKNSNDLSDSPTRLSKNKTNGSIGQSARSTRPPAKGHVSIGKIAVNSRNAFFFNRNSDRATLGKIWRKARVISIQSSSPFLDAIGPSERFMAELCTRNLVLTTLQLPIAAHPPA